MAVVKRLVCLANSRKWGGRCVAGRELLGGDLGPWIRPVSPREREELLDFERRYGNGADPRPLDILDVPLAGPRPHRTQPENWLIAPDQVWVKRGRWRRDRLRAWLDPAGPLWLNGQSTREGLNDRIPLETAEGLGSSLRLIRVGAATLRVTTFRAQEGEPRKRLQCQFERERESYSLWVTDPRLELRYLGKAEGLYRIGPSYLTISLGEPFEGSCHKLVACLIRDRWGGGTWRL